MGFINYDVVKALHIIFVVCWFAGLFYMVRLFIYHIEAFEKSEIESDILHNQYQIMEKNLWNIITTPAMILTIIFGTTMLILNPFYLSQPWMHVKLTFVLVLLFYHFKCSAIMKRLRTKSFKWTSTQLRLWNELATMFLVSIVFIVVLKSSMNWVLGTVGFFLVGVLLMMAIKLYKKIRLKQ